MQQVFKIQLWLVAILHLVLWISLSINSSTSVSRGYYTLEDFLLPALLLIPTLIFLVAALRYTRHPSSSWWLHFAPLTIETMLLAYVLFQLQPFLYSDVGNWTPTSGLIEPCGFTGCGPFIFFAKVALFWTALYFAMMTNALYIRFKTKDEPDKEMY